MVSVSNLSLRLGDFRLSDVSFEIEAGEYGVLMGKTGCGKTSILEAICGLRRITSGTIRLCGVDVTRRRASERGIGYVPQDGALFETMTVREHLMFALRVRRCDSHAAEQQIARLAELLEIESILNRTPQGLSGGEIQRVAMGRALSFEPKILLLDEPLSALDDETRSHLYDVIRKIREHTNFTALHITHSKSEALTLGDRILRLNEGRIVDVDKYHEERRRAQQWRRFVQCHSV